MILLSMLLVNAFAVPSEPDATWGSNSDGSVHTEGNCPDWCSIQNYQEELECAALYGSRLSAGESCWGFDFTPGACRLVVETGCLEQWGDSQCVVQCADYSGGTYDDVISWLHYHFLH
jgi:hypothetical protein